VLADAGIPCNAVSAYYHHYLVVPRELTLRALEVLMKLVAGPAETSGRNSA
jgi:hypothetical protein